MPSDYYSDNPGESEIQTAAPDTSSTPERKDADEGETFLVSKSALGGKEPEPGDICEFKCVRVYEDEAEFKYQKHNESESENEDMAKAHEDMDMMAEEGG